MNIVEYLEAMGDFICSLPSNGSEKDENGKKKSYGAIIVKCQQLKNLNEEDLESFILHFQIFCWFKIIKKPIIKK